MPNPEVRIPFGGYRVIRMSDFSKGEDRKGADYASPRAGFLDRIKNFYLSHDGTLIGRRGTVRWNATSLGSGAVLGHTRAYADQSSGSFIADAFFVAAHAGTIYVGDDSAQTFTASLTGLDSDADYWFLQVGRFLFATNGVDPHRKMDVNTQLWTPWGLSSPTVGPVAAAGAAGILNGSYTFKITYRLASGAESDGSPASNTVTPVNQQVDLTAIPIGPTGTTERRVYGFKNNVSSDYQLIATISNNTATTYTVTTDQDSWTSSIPADNDNDPPPPGAWITAYHKRRIWMIGDKSDDIYFSKVGVPASALEAFPSTNSLVVQFMGGEYGTALLPYGDVMYIFGQDSVHYVTGDLPTNFKVIKTFSPVGAPGPWAVDIAQIPGEGSVPVFLSRAGIYLIRGREVAKISEAEDPFFTNIPEVEAKFAWR